MKLSTEETREIQDAFYAMQHTDDLVALINFAKTKLYGPKSFPINKEQLHYFSNEKYRAKIEESWRNELPGLERLGFEFSTETYKVFEINKKNGSKRIIHAPALGLKHIQRALALILQCVFTAHKAAYGFVKNKSIVDNARQHTGMRYVYNIDLKDFFSSIEQPRLRKCLELDPFNLNHRTSKEIAFEELGIFKKDILKVDGPLTLGKFHHGRKAIQTRLGLIYVAPSTDLDKPLYVVLADESIKSKRGENLENTLWLVNKVPSAGRLKIANVIANMCCVPMEVERKNQSGEWQKVQRKVLPQGAPTSPVLTNVICQRLDQLLTGLAKRFGLNYTRYADDITFSSMHNVYQSDGEFIRELNRIIQDQGFHIKESKTRLQREAFRQEVTGLLVNEKANVQQRYIKQLRMWLYYWERYGYERASGFFLKEYIADKGHTKNGKPDMANVISGKLDYLKMVKGAENELYQKLKVRFEKITGKVTSISKNLIEVEEAETSNTPLMKLLPGLKKQPIAISEKKILDVPTEAKTDENTIPVFHKPKELVALLKYFSVNDSALKYTTHSWDAGRDANMFKDLSEFLKKAESQYRKFSFQLNSLSKNLHGKINTFLFDKEIAKKGWGDINPKKRIYFGWSSPELLKACNDDVSLNPEDFILPEKYQVQRAGKTLQKFKHIIDVFKNEIEVRDENSALLNLILQKHDHYLISFSAPKVSNLENKTFYTDIQWLGKAIDLIFEGIQKYPQHSVVEYAVTESNNDRLILTILHRNSFKNGLSIHDDKLNLKRGDFSTIKDKLKNLCDWCI